MIGNSRMRDVAALAGVSTMTVSRALSGSANVTEEVRDRIETAVRKLNYHPNEVARSLRHQRSKQIGIIVPNLLDPFFATCAHGASTIAKKNGYSVVIALSDDDSSVEREQVLSMARRHVEGIVLLPGACRHDPLLWRLRSAPVVVLDHPLEDAPLDTVMVDNRCAAADAVRHLIRLRHHKIIHLNMNPAAYTLQQRDQGYRDAMLEAGLVPQTLVVRDPSTEIIPILQDLRQKQRKLALFCSNNVITRNTLHAISALDLSIPQDVVLVGFDDFETADLLKPGITVIRQPILDLGKQGAEMLFRRIRSREETYDREQITLPLKLIIRGSCGAPKASWTPHMASKD
ncbi:LacI family DNA-binding transcriptional regulator [Granulicella sp. dw_53]|uniref:LacI family DNA-binding transcriptional regulator n=1 Tax=Granulicella sp. dw_53 TaxID=2719792 RepID=UPI001BD219DD|nr:LacI family DNA-binding transcriptional regulator [Granulicella sp. dw_53]